MSRLEDAIEQRFFVKPILPTIQTFPCAPALGDIAGARWNPDALDRSLSDMNDLSVETSCLAIHYP